MKLNEKQFSSGIKVISNDINRKILFSLYEDKAYRYSELRKIIEDYRKWGGSSGKFAYYLRRLHDKKIVKKENGIYFLTRFGLQITKLVYEMQNICMEYDLNDCDADGKIMVMIKR